MAVVEQLKKDSAMTDLEKYTLHAVRSLLKSWNVRHSIWDIVIHQTSAHTLEVTAWIPMNITLPPGQERPLHPIYFNQTCSDVMREFTDVQFQPIARELAKQMMMAMQMGIKYGTQ